MHHPIAYLAKMMGNIIHLHQALHQTNACQFVDVVIKEINGCIYQKHLVVTPRAGVPNIPRFYPRDTIATSRPRLSQSTRQDSIFMGESRILV
jgi:hypothetical protein